MDHSELMRIYPVCPKPTCGKQYTTEQLYQLPKPRCTWNVGERCPGVLYTERLLADGTIKRSPSKLFPYIPLPAALGRLLSRPGMSELCQHWRNNDNPKDEPTKNPPRPQDPVEWFDDMPANQRFSDISKGWGWRAHATGLTQQFIDGDLTLNADGYQANGGNYTAGGSYTSNGVYIVINNLPYFEWNLFENTILAMVLPGPTEPKDYAFNQMMEPLIDNLISLSNGVDLPVHDAETGEIQDRRVYANLLVLVVDWIARIKCTGHVGATAEENHCPYCKLRACLLSTGRGYDHEGYDLCDPHKHLQDKHQWLRAEWHKRNDIRNETGTTFTELDRLSGFYAFDNAPTDVMHLVDLGLTEAIKTCRRLPTHAQGLKGRVKADQRRLSRLIMIGSYFEAWRVGNSIPDGDIPRGSERSKHYKAQKANAKAFRRRRNHVNDLDGGKLDKVPPWHEFMPLRNPRNWFANLLRFCLLEQVGTVFTDMNIHLTPSFHAITHLPDHLYKYGSVYNTSTAQFERANQMLINVNKNGHGGGEIEATMAKGFMRCVECYRYINELQLIERPTDDNTATTKLLLQGMRDAPEHEVQHGRLDAILAGDAQFLEQEHIRLATAPAKVNFQDHKHRGYYNLMVEYCNNHRPVGLHNVRFYGRSTLTYPHFRWYGVRYGSANHTQGFGSRYGYIGDQVPVIIQGIYKSTVAVLGEEHKFLAVMVQRFVAPAEPPAFPWNHWDHILGIGAWEYQELQPVEAVPATAFTGLFALSNIEMSYGRFWLTFAMITTRPDNLMDGDNMRVDD
ncbi:Transposase family Tnp2 protein [Rhizoctonia solani]|uniref:Transposase family Tnp2 protein n=1 Tax=Rhizoctonia solani TaxID=456999 RepID=A0A8H8P3P3_9AGAM|nr:Transposase family Tnp2 protein [Rhizoctonia solani]QRW24949.1 Transposase family Tnp2 protein [Rhizoctonia solani]